jgi:hypothetical protein
VRIKVWKGATEPTAWRLTATDSTAAFQVPGSIGLIGYLSARSTVAPVTILVDDLQLWTTG